MSTISPKDNPIDNLKATAFGMGLHATYYPLEQGMAEHKYNEYKKLIGKMLEITWDDAYSALQKEEKEMDIFKSLKEAFPKLEHITIYDQYKQKTFRITYAGTKYDAIITNKELADSAYEISSLFYRDKLTDFINQMILGRGGNPAPKKQRKTISKKQRELKKTWMPNW